MGSDGSEFLVLVTVAGATTTVAEATTTVLFFLLTRAGVAIEFEELGVRLPLFDFCRRALVFEVLFALFLAMVDSDEKRNKIKQLCCGTVNPINASSWEVSRRAPEAIDQRSVEMLVLR